MRLTRKLAFLAAALIAPLSGCTCHSTGSTHVGVLTRKVTLGGVLGKTGIDPEIRAPGATYLFPAFITDWATYDISLQNLGMVRDPARGDRQGEDDVSFKTIDGNDIRVDVTVAWQIDPKRAPYLLNKVGDSTEKVKEKLVRPACRSIVRDVLNELNSEEFYVSDKRFEKANKARERLASFLNPEGVLVMQVILGEHHFHPQYEQVIHDKKLAEQNARAKAIQKENEALAGAGGKTMVKLRLAEALAGKQLLFVPTGKGGVGLQTLNLNQLLAIYAAGQALEGAGASAEPDTVERKSK